ncbi:hypothetical protein BOX15_Mlig004971g1 [Macrostomum lignano]|uniref:Cation-dependent mannose-6-phosphate receptor n=1 Tax=Macrostomum lignano TaxID=282301 RepID=A0A267H423_9PLAT|nr:hypothetical protein BOX15_Mlig004971g1 [Macrostomum lignano]
MHPKILIFVSIFSAVHSQQVTCVKQINNCKCETSSGKFIDLSPIASASGFQFKRILGPNRNWLYSYNPCTGVQCESGSDAASCQNSAAGSQEFLLGLQSTAKFGYDSTYGLYIKYDNKQSGGIIRESMVSLVCSPDATDKFEPTDDGGISSPFIFHSKLTSKHACEVDGGGGGGSGGGGMSGGDVLIIIVLVLLVVYLAGGFAVNVFLLKKTANLQALPNLNFWISVPGYVKDGATFTAAKVRGLATGSKQNYENI